VAVERFIATQFSDKLCKLILRLVNEGSLQLLVFNSNIVRQLVQMLIMLQTGQEEQALGSDQSRPAEETSKRSFTASSATLEQVQSGTTMLGRNQRPRFTPMIH
jgi:hypothetical protein